MKLNEFKKIVKKILQETVVEKTITRLENIVEAIGVKTALDDIIRKLDDETVNRVLEQIESDYDLGVAEEPESVEPGEEEENLGERHLTKPEQHKKEEIVKSMKDTKSKIADMKAKYGDRWKQVAYATATKMAKEKKRK